MNELDDALSVAVQRVTFAAFAEEGDGGPPDPAASAAVVSHFPLN